MYKGKEKNLVIRCRCLLNNNITSVVVGAVAIFVKAVERWAAGGSSPVLTYWSYWSWMSSSSWFSMLLEPTWKNTFLPNIFFCVSVTQNDDGSSLVDPGSTAQRKALSTSACSRMDGICYPFWPDGYYHSFNTATELQLCLLTKMLKHVQEFTSVIYFLLTDTYALQSSGEGGSRGPPQQSLDEREEKFLIRSTHHSLTPREHRTFS